MKLSTIELTHSHRCEIESPFLFEFVMVKRGGKRAPNLNKIITKIMCNNNWGLKATSNTLIAN